MVESLGHNPGPMVVSRVGEGHWMFLDMKTRTELIVSLDEAGRPRGTVWTPEITPPVRKEMGPLSQRSRQLPRTEQKGAVDTEGSGRGGM